MFMAANALHQLGYIHRDLKPEVNRSHIYLSANRSANSFSVSLKEFFDRQFRTHQVDGLWTFKRSTEQEIRRIVTRPAGSSQGSTTNLQKVSGKKKHIQLNS